ncbi:hypothetical protein [Acinetobacter beijerinckii]|uniref:hypothetical protein n=1 Tax=Acinetobacter beijerinckii TaxID=262668 RepID=UPI003AF5A4C9
MAIKLFKVFLGGYEPNYDLLIARGYKILPNLRKMMVVLNSNQGFGKVNGTTKKLGSNYSPVSVCLFRRDNRQLLWETASKADGSYSFRNVALGLECFIVAFDPNNQYNAVIQDKIQPFDGRTG